MEIAEYLKPATVTDLLGRKTGAGACEHRNRRSQMLNVNNGTICVPPALGMVFAQSSERFAIYICSTCLLGFGLIGLWADRTRYFQATDAPTAMTVIGTARWLFWPLSASALLTALGLFAGYLIHAGVRREAHRSI